MEPLRRGKDDLLARDGQFYLSHEAVHGARGTYYIAETAGNDCQPSGRRPHFFLAGQLVSFVSQLRQAD